MKTISKSIQTTISKSKYVLLALLISFSFSCSPEDGEQGPPGEDGNANVQASDWFQFQLDYVNGTDDYGYMTVDIPNFQEFVDNGGAVMMFLRQSLGNEYIIHPLPYQDIFFFGLANVPSESVENSLVLFADDTNVSNYENNPELVFRYVLIPGNTTAKNGVNYTKMSYEDLMDYLGLKQ